MTTGRELLKRILRDLHGIPPMPHVIQKVMSMTQDPDITADQLNEVITLDQALTANVLKLCNSAYYGLPRQIASVSQAVTYLGFQTIRNLVLTSFLSEVYGGAVAGSGTGSGLWEHSIAASAASQLICRQVKRPDANDISFTCGLLHDIGKTILMKFSRETMPEILGKVEKEGKSFFEAEREVLGFDHAALGAKVADVWNFPPTLVQAIGLHHTPERAQGDRFLTHVTHLANHLAIEYGAGIEQPELFSTPLCEESLKELHLEPDDLETIKGSLHDAYQKASPFIGMKK